jgi:hypothetical protein
VEDKAAELLLEGQVKAGSSLKAVAEDGQVKLIPEV